MPKQNSWGRCNFTKEIHPLNINTDEMVFGVFVTYLYVMMMHGRQEKRNLEGRPTETRMRMGSSNRSANVFDMRKDDVKWEAWR